MAFYELAETLRAMKVATGIPGCLGCRHEDNCGIKSCSILEEAASAIDILQKEFDKAVSNWDRARQECARLREDQRNLLEA